jgi:hypothetical protein
VILLFRPLIITAPPPPHHPHFLHRKSKGCRKFLRDILGIIYISKQSTFNRGLQRDVVYLGWPIASSYMSPNAKRGGELRGLKQWVQLYTGAQINFGDLTPYLTYGCYPLSGMSVYVKLRCVWNYVPVFLCSKSAPPPPLSPATPPRPPP